MKTAKIIFAGLSAFLATYLLGAFGNASFDISEWNELSRTIVAVLGGTISALSGMFVYESKGGVK